MGTPDRTHPVVPGQVRVRVLRDIGDGEVACKERLDQRSEPHDQQCELSGRERPGGTSPGGVRRARIARGGKADGHRERDDSGEVTEFDDHLTVPSWAFIPASSGGM